MTYWREYLERNRLVGKGRGEWRVTRDAQPGGTMQRRFYVQSFPNVHPSRACTGVVRRGGWEEMKRAIDSVPQTPNYEALKRHGPIRRRPKTDLILGLPDEADRRISSALALDADATVNDPDAAIPITAHDLATCSNSNWLNDEVLNGYLRLIVDRFPGSMFVHNTFFYAKLCRQGHAGVARWTKGVDVFREDLTVLLPLHLGNHWTLVCIDNAKRALSYHDGLGGSNGQALGLILQWLEDEWAAKHGPARFPGYTTHTPPDLPRQRNGFDCGVFVCVYALCIALHRNGLLKDGPMPFSQQDMPYFRRRIAFELLTNKLLV